MREEIQEMLERKIDTRKTGEAKQPIKMNLQRGLMRFIFSIF